MAEKRERSEEMDKEGDATEKHARFEKSPESDPDKETSSRSCNTGGEGDHIGYQESTGDKYECKYTNEHDTFK